MTYTINSDTLYDLMLCIDVEPDPAEWTEGDYLTTSYSGRGMFGATCVGIVTGDPGRIMFRLARELGARVGYGDDEADELLDAFENYRQDSMGLSSIIYWPDVRSSEDLYSPSELDSPVGDRHATSGPHPFEAVVHDEPRHDVQERV